MVKTGELGVMMVTGGKDFKFESYISNRVRRTFFDFDVLRTAVASAGRFAAGEALATRERGGDGSRGVQ